MTPDLGKLLVRPALKRWLAENGYGWIEDYAVRESVCVDVYASSAIHHHAMTVLPVHTVTSANLPDVVKICRMWRTALPSSFAAVAVPQDGISELSRLKLVAVNIRVIVLEGAMTQRQYDDWMSSRIGRIVQQGDYPANFEPV